jgi:hypothetical protein
MGDRASLTDRPDASVGPPAVAIKSFPWGTFDPSEVHQRMPLRDKKAVAAHARASKLSVQFKAFAAPKRRPADDRLISKQIVCYKANLTYPQGELLAAMKARGELDAGKGGDRKSRFRAGTVKKLKDFNISKKQSARWQQLAALPKEKCEAQIEAAKRRAVVKITPPRSKPPSEQDAITRCVAAVKAAIVRAIKIVAPEALFAAANAEIKTLAAARGYDVGAASASQLAHQDEYIAQLERKVQQQELTIAGLRREREETL